MAWLGTLVLSVGTYMEDLEASMTGAKLHKSIQYTSLSEATSIRMLLFKPFGLRFE